MEKEGTKTEKTHVCFGLLLMTNAPRNLKTVTTQQIFDTFRPQQRSAEHWPAKQVICGTFLVFLPLLFCGPLAGEESAPDGAEQAAAAWSGAYRCWCALARAKWPYSRTSLAGHAFSRSFGAILLFVSSHSANNLQAALCRTASRISIAVFSLSLPRIWLSHSTSKTDALDDDETPRRFTASQTATTRRVMVSGIVTLHRRCTSWSLARKSMVRSGSR